MARDVVFQIRMSEEEREIYESVARVKGRCTLPQYIRLLMDEQYRQTDWFLEGERAGEEGVFVGPAHGDPDHQDQKDFTAGWMQGNENRGAYGD